MNNELDRDCPSDTSGGTTHMEKVQVHNGDLIARDQIFHGDKVAGNKYHIEHALFGEDKIDWEKVSFQAFLSGVKDNFYRHMRMFASATTDQDSMHRYFPLNFQAQKPSRRKTTTGKAAYEIRTDKWYAFARLPTNILVIGGPGSGKNNTFITQCSCIRPKGTEK